MNSQTNNKIKQIDVRFRTLIVFLVITFGLAWGILSLFIFLPDQMTGFFGQLTGQHPLFYLCVYAPAIATFFIVIYNNGMTGLRHFLSRFLLWRCTLSWYLFLFGGLPLVFIIGSAIKGTLFSDSFPFSSFQMLVIALVLAMIKGPIEEFGWRGLALPLLQRKLAPLWAGLVLGIVWGLWHIPAFLLSGTQQSAWSFTPFLLGTIAMSIIMTPLFNRSGGSIFLTALFHFQAINPIFPDAQPFDTYLLIFIAALVVVVNRRTMFTKDGAATEVVPQDNV